VPDFDTARAREIAEPQVGPPEGVAVWNVLARLLLEACDEIDRCRGELPWPEPAPLPSDYAESAE
jgi:hypothetical protein